MIEPGKLVELSYPDTTLVEAAARLEKRSIHVTRIRDLVVDPLTPEEFFRRPFVRRSRWLIFGFDERRQEFRQFYLGTSLEHHSPGFLKAALYEPESARPAYAVSRPFGPSRSERRLLARALQHWTKQELEDLQLRIYADDLAIHRPSSSPRPRVIRFVG